MDDVDLKDKEDSSSDDSVDWDANSEKTSISEIKSWDPFLNIPEEAESEYLQHNHFYDAVIKAIKVFVYLIVFGVVLSGSVIAKSALILMTSQLKPNLPNREILYCNPGHNHTYTTSKVTLFPKEEQISWIRVIFFTFLIPEVQVLLRSLRIWTFKGASAPTFEEFCIPWFFESLSTIGTALFVFCVLPSLDAVTGVMLTNGLCLLPSNLLMIRKHRRKSTRSIMVTVVDTFAVLLQISALVVVPVVRTLDMNTPSGPLGTSIWWLPPSLILISFGWWENYMNASSEIPFFAYLGRMKGRFSATRYITYSVIPIWKGILFFLFILVTARMNEIPVDSNENFDILDGFSYLFSQNHNLSVVNYLSNGTELTESSDTIVIRSGSIMGWAFVSQVVAAYLAFICAKYACKIHIQHFSFALPITLATPVAIFLIASSCAARENNACFWNDTFPPHIFWTCPEKDVYHEIFVAQFGWVWVFWLISQIYISAHIWFPKSELLAKTEKLFVTPMYNGFFIDQSLGLNRKRVDALELTRYKKLHDRRRREGRNDSIPDDNDVDFHPIPRDDIHNPAEDEIPRIIACATMWHENKEEMVQMLKSIFRMDEDQCARTQAKRYFEYVQYYEYSTHIFFDDAFTLKDPKDPNSGSVINPFVRDFISTVETAAEYVHQTRVRIRPPKRIPTPYGGRLEWKLPGGTRMICHLKDKSKIRHRKRWSQVMYMYYLLGKLLMDDNSFPVARKEIRAENTFLLALDGDIDFKPNAVSLLVDLMRRNKQLGAACGRIHPVGNGPMVWYQKFEYAVGHWFQKATEHVFGCVLCSPGCFSLFRAKALMDDNVMARYTTMSEEPRHYVQYDQGEDRWLCTLLLQRGYRVDYCAAADAKTHAPETFAEFYNQRRRWVPSTTANIMDLLMDYERVVKVNPDISMFYIAYQFMLMIGTILGPGTIFLMLVGAFVVVFDITNWTSFWINIFPVCGFMGVCYFTKADVQLLVAQILSAVYALIMVAVLVALALELVENGILAPTSLFLIIITASFLIAGILHPTEFSCLPHGFLYYITIPSMYLFLILYSLFNLDNVSWGTREVPQMKTPQELAEERRLSEVAKAAKKPGFLAYIPWLKETKDSLYDVGCGTFCKVSCCLKPVTVDPTETEVLLPPGDGDVDLEVDLSRRLSNVSKLSHASTRQSRLLVEEKRSEQTVRFANDEVHRDDLVNPHWLEDDLLTGPVDFLDSDETTFWQDMISKYLQPIDADKKKEAETKKGLIELRNKSVFAFFMANAIFVLLVFFIQVDDSKTLYIPWPFGSKSHNMTSRDGIFPDCKDPESDPSFCNPRRMFKCSLKAPDVLDVFETCTEYLQLEPVGSAFLVFFSFVLLIQFLGMVFHRFGTMSQILGNTTLVDCNRKGQERKLGEDGLGLIHRLQNLRKLESTMDNDNLDVTRRPTVAKLKLNGQLKKKKPLNLKRQFSINLEAIASRETSEAQTIQKDYFLPPGDTTMEELRRRSTYIRDGYSDRKSFNKIRNGRRFTRQASAPEELSPTPEERDQDFSQKPGHVNRSRSFFHRNNSNRETNYELESRQGPRPTVDVNGNIPARFANESTHQGHFNEGYDFGES